MQKKELLNHYNEHYIYKNIDDAIQHALLEYAKKSMTNFDNFKHDNFYAYSLKFFNIWTDNYISRYYNKISLETELDISVDLKDNTDNDKTHMGNPEQKFLREKKKNIKMNLYVTSYKL